MPKLMQVLTVRDLMLSHKETVICVRFKMQSIRLSHQTGSILMFFVGV